MRSFDFKLFVRKCLDVCSWCVSAWRMLTFPLCVCMITREPSVCVLLGLWLLTKGPWCCSSSVSRWGPVGLLLSSLLLIFKTQSDRSVPALIRPPGSLLCVAGRDTKSGPYWRLINLLHRPSLIVCLCVVPGLCHFVVRRPAGRSLWDIFVLLLLWLFVYLLLNVFLIALALIVLAGVCPHFLYGVANLWLWQSWSRYCMYMNTSLLLLHPANTSLTVDLKSHPWHRN